MGEGGGGGKRYGKLSADPGIHLRWAPCIGEGSWDCQGAVVSLHHFMLIQSYAKYGKLMSNQKKLCTGDDSADRRTE